MLKQCKGGVITLTQHEYKQHDKFKLFLILLHLNCLRLAPFLEPYVTSTGFEMQQD